MNLTQFGFENWEEGLSRTDSGFWSLIALLYNVNLRGGAIFIANSLFYGYKLFFVYFCNFGVVAVSRDIVQFIVHHHNTICRCHTHILNDFIFCVTGKIVRKFAKFTLHFICKIQHVSIFKLLSKIRQLYDFD